MDESMTPMKMKKPILQDSHTIQVGILHKEIPKYRRQKYKIESKEALYKRIDIKKDQSRRLHFIPFDYHHKTTRLEEVGHIRQTLKASSKIARSCKFHFWQNRDVNCKIFAQLGQEIKKAQGLKTADFDLSSTLKINDLALKNMSIGLKPLKHLQYLKIKLLMCPNVNNKGFADIGRAVKRLPSLETLDLRFNDGGTGTYKGFTILWRGLKYLKGLKQLNMGFNSEHRIPFEKVSHADKGFKWFKSLKVIKLEFETIWMTHLQRIQHLSKMLKGLTGLEEVHLRFTLCHIDDQSLETLMEGFQEKSKLKRITLKIVRASVTNKGLFCLQECFQALREIECITIDLEGCEEVTKEGAEDLKKSLEEIPSLRRLEVKLDA